VSSQGYSSGTLHTLQTDDPVSAHDQITLPNTSKGQLVVQVVDDAEGPSTKREYEVARVPVGAALCGQVVDFLGCPHGSQYQLGMDAQLPLLNDQLDMKSREQINSASFTGIKVMYKALSSGTTATCLLGFAVSPSLLSCGRASFDLLHSSVQVFWCCLQLGAACIQGPCSTTSPKFSQDAQGKIVAGNVKSTGSNHHRVTEMVHLYRLLIH